MPYKYERLRDKFNREGLDYDKAQEKAARIFNSQREPGEKPVTGRRYRRSPLPPINQLDK